MGTESPECETKRKKKRTARESVYRYTCVDKRYRERAEGGEKTGKEKSTLRTGGDDASRRFRMKLSKRESTETTAGNSSMNPRDSSVQGMGFEGSSRVQEYFVVECCRPGAGGLVDDEACQHWPLALVPQPSPSRPMGRLDPSGHR